MAQAFAVISAIGADRVGIVDELSGAITTTGANIEESKMAVLGGDFAVMVLVSLEASRYPDLVAAMPSLEALGLKVSVTPTKESSAQVAGRPYALETVSLDGKGIVHSVSAVLHRHGINIEELETRTEGAPLTGAPLFRMRAEVVIGPEVHVASLRRELEALQADEDLDIRLEPLVAARRD